MVHCDELQVQSCHDDRPSGHTRKILSPEALVARRLERRWKRRFNRHWKNKQVPLTREQYIAVMQANCRLTSPASTVSSSSDSSALMRATSLDGIAGATTSDDSSSDGIVQFWEHTMEGLECRHKCFVEVAIRHRCRLGTTIIWASDAIGFQEFRELIYASLDIEDNSAGACTQLLDLTVEGMKLERDMQLRCYLTSLAPKPPVTLHGRIPMGALQLDVGRPVVLHGLTSASHLNGSQGRLQQWDAAAELWQVFLITGPDKGKLKVVKGWNLFPVVEAAVPLAIYAASEVNASGLVAFAEDMLQQVGKTAEPYSFAMDTWLRLPGMGDAFVRFVANEGHQDHLFYKFVNQHQAFIEFFCPKWHSEIIRFEATDVLVFCEVKEAWRSVSCARRS